MSSDDFAGIMIFRFRFRFRFTSSLFIFICMQILSSLLGLIMAEVQLKRRAFFLIIFTSICFRKLCL